MIAVANEKGGVGKTTTSVNLGIGLARHGKKVLIADADPQGSLTVSLGYREPEKLTAMTATVMSKILNDVPVPAGEAIIRHSEGADILPANIELCSKPTAMNRERLKMRLWKSNRR